MPAQCRMPTAWPTSYAPQSCCSLDCRLVAGALSPANCSLDVNGRSDGATLPGFPGRLQMMYTVERLVCH